MKWLLGTYTGRYNRRHKLFGHLFSGRYKALVVDSASPGYLKMVCDYVHLNPVRAKLLSAEEPQRALAAGDDDDAGMDCGALADGKREHVEEYAAIGQ